MLPKTNCLKLLLFANAGGKLYLVVTNLNQFKRPGVSFKTKCLKTDQFASFKSIEI